MFSLPDDRHLTLKVYYSYLFDYAHLEKGNFTFSHGAPYASMEVKYFYSWFGGNWLRVTIYYAKLD